MSAVVLIEEEEVIPTDPTGRFYLAPTVLEKRGRAAEEELDKPPDRDDFPTLLRLYRERARRSRNELAKKVGVDPSYLTRAENGQRDAPRQHIIVAVARELNLSPYERNRLLASAGFIPLSVAQFGHWDETLQEVVDVLRDFTISQKERDEFSWMVKLLAQKWGSV